MTDLLFPVAVPSWIVPGTAADSVHLLRALPSLHVEGCCVAEVGLCCFEGQSSLDAPMSDYPSVSDLAESTHDASEPLSLRVRLPLKLHVHLPLNLAWAEGTTGSDTEQSPCRMALALMRKFSPLGVTRAVLHPPPQDTPHASRLHLLRAFVQTWQSAGLDPAHILLENDAYCTAPEFLALLDGLPISVCVDVAHLMAYNQEQLLNDVPPERVGLLHWSAPGPVPRKDAHQPLTELTPQQYAIARVAAARFALALPLVEVFDWAGVQRSLPVLRELYSVA